jgi:AraC-like DNA-binding protein
MLTSAPSSSTATTLHAYRNQLRLRAALERVADPGSDLLSVAIDLGYSSHSHLSEAFRRTFKLTPSALRGRFAPGP